MPDALPAATLPIYPGLGQAQEYAGLHTPVAWFLLWHLQTNHGLALYKLYVTKLVAHGPICGILCIELLKNSVSNNELNIIKGSQRKQHNTI